MPRGMVSRAGAGTGEWRNLTLRVKGLCEIGFVLQFLISALRARPAQPAGQATATASISTFHSGLTSPATTMVDDAAL